MICVGSSLASPRIVTANVPFTVFLSLYKIKEKTVSTHSQAVQKKLYRLYRFNQESELGIETMAGHIKNRGLKILLKTYADQRARFAEELLAAAGNPDEAPPVPRNLLASIHRGWIDIKASLTIGRESVEQVVLAQAARGENAALRAYRNALQTPLPEEVQQMLQQQMAAIEKVSERLQKLAGQRENQLVVQLFDSAQVAQQAIISLDGGDVLDEQIRLGELSQSSRAYPHHRQRQRALEPGMTGMLLGILLGVVLGVVAGFAANWYAPTLPLWSTVLLTTLGGILCGGVMGGLNGMFIGVATAEDDVYLYEQSMRHGDTLVTVETDPGRARQVRQMLSSLQRSAMAAA